MTKQIIIQLWHIRFWKSPPPDAAIFPREELLARSDDVDFSAANELVIRVI